MTRRRPCPCVTSNPYKSHIYNIDIIQGLLQFVTLFSHRKKKGQPTINRSISCSEKLKQYGFKRIKKLFFTILSMSILRRLRLRKKKKNTKQKLGLSRLMKMRMLMTNRLKLVWTGPDQFEPVVKWLKVNNLH